MAAALPVTVVSGLPRSGTSMMMRMLAAGGLPPLVDHVRLKNEDNPGGYYEFEPVKRTKQDASWLRQASGKCVKMVYRLLYDLPPGYEYRVLMMQRDLVEVLASQRAMLRREGRDDLVDDANMAAAFRSELAQCDQWLAAQPNFKSLAVDYCQVVSNATSAVAMIDEFLGRSLDRSAMCAEIDQSLYRNRRASTPQPLKEVE